MAQKPKTPKKTKHGMRIISPDDDLLALFNESDNSGETISHAEHAHIEKKHPQKVTRAKKTPSSDSSLQSRLPQTSQKISVHAQHTPADYDGADDDNFEDMLKASLSKMKIEDILAEKHGDVAEKVTTIREIVKTHPAPQMQIDLHGCNREEAERKADSFIYNASYKGLKTVRIIVGKGIHSTGGAVLPDVIKKKVIALKREQVVLNYCWEKGKKHKSGAMIVYLT